MDCFFGTLKTECPHHFKFKTRDHARQVVFDYEAIVSRAVEAFAEGCLAERVHEALIKEPLGDQLIGRLSCE